MIVVEEVENEEEEEEQEVNEREREREKKRVRQGGRRLLELGDKSQQLCFKPPPASTERNASICVARRRQRGQCGVCDTAPAAEGVQCSKFKTRI